MDGFAIDGRRAVFASEMAEALFALVDILIAVVKPTRRISIWRKWANAFPIFVNKSDAAAFIDYMNELIKRYKEQVLTSHKKKDPKKPGDDSKKKPDGGGTKKPDDKGGTKKPEREEDPGEDKA